MKLFQIDYERLVLLLLPPFLRQPRLFAFLVAMTTSVSKLYARFIENRNKNKQRIRCNGQVCYLRALLNDTLDPDERRITVTDSDIETWLILYDETEENAPCVLYDETEESERHTIIYDEASITGNAGIFLVTVPWAAEDINKNNRLRDLLNEYKLTGCRYAIINQNSHG